MLIPLPSLLRSRMYLVGHIIPLVKAMSPSGYILREAVLSGTHLSNGQMGL